MFDMITFPLKQKVYITELEKSGMVMAIYISETGTQYSVRYFDNCEARTVYFYDNEIEVIKEAT